jgi:hypothetical protein
MYQPLPAINQINLTLYASGRFIISGWGKRECPFSKKNSNGALSSPGE